MAAARVHSGGVNRNADDEILFATADGTAVLWAGRSLIQVRRLGISIAEVDTITSRLREIVAANTHHHGALLVLEATALVVSEAVRNHQRSAFGDLMKRRDVSTALVVLGDSITAQMQRTLARMFSLGAPAFKVFSQPDDGVAWLVDEFRKHDVTCDAEAFKAAVAAARRFP